MGENSVVNLSKEESEPSSCVRSLILDWDPRAMLNSLSVLEQKIHQVQSIVHSIANHGDQFSNQENKIVAQQQLVTADLTYIIIQLITTAGTLLPSTKSSPVSSNATSEASGGSMLQAKKLSELEEIIKGTIDCQTEGDVLIKSLQNGKSEAAEISRFEEGDLKDAHDGSYEVLQLEIDEILAFHTHFCMICGKGFKRDANLRMHMRGHGNEYKSSASLAKPPAKELSSGLKPIMRYSCPFAGCKRNKDHKKFLPLKTILCVKNHYKRSHCDKRYTCSRCHSKKFSVLADLKTHEKHCGRDNWLCSCGTTFSRKDKLFGHVTLFQGHAPMHHHLEVCKASEGLDGEDKAVDASDVACELGARSLDEGSSLFSPIEFDSYCFGGISELARQTFNVSEGPFSFAGSGSSNFILRDNQNLSFNQLG